MGRETIRRSTGKSGRALKLDWSKLFSVVARTALKAASARFEEAWDEVFRGAEAVGLTGKPDAPILAWLLLHTALARSVFVLLSETRARNPDLPYRTEGDGAAVIEAGRLIPDDFEVRRDFLTRPETLPFLEPVRTMLADWFTGLGVPAAEAQAMADRLDGILPRELREEWRRDIPTWQPIRAWLETPVDDAVRRQDAWDRATSRIKALPHEPVFGEAFSLRDVFVPLRAYTVAERGGRRRSPDGEPVERANPAATLGWLDEMLLAWIDGPPGPDDALRVISGGPGSGKTSAARMMAAGLAGRPDLRVLYVPLHRLRLRGELRAALAEHCRDWVFDDGVDPLDALEPQRRLVLFLDGLDELTSNEDRAAHDLADQFARELRTFLAERNQRAVRVLAIVGGRELAIQSTTEARFRAAPVLHVFPFAKNRELELRFDWRAVKTLFDRDQRPDWWRKFGDVTGTGPSGIPEAVKANDKLLTLTELPLLNYLVAGFARRHGAQITGRTSVADVYDALIRDVYERAWGRTGDGDAGPAARDLAPHVVEAERFFAVLEEIALAVWHGSGRGAALATIHAYLEQADLSGLIKPIQSKLESGIANLLLTFFFRKDTDAHGHEFFEFTHKSFQEYLTARRVLRAADDLTKAGSRTRDFKPALARWVETTGPSMITREIAGFMDREAARQYDSLRRRAMRDALCFLFGYQLAEGLPVEDAEGPGGTGDGRWPTRFGIMREWSDRAEVALLATISALADRFGTPKPDREAVAARIALPDATSFKAMLERLSHAECRDTGRSPMAPLTAQSLRGFAPTIGPWEDVAEKENEKQNRGGVSLFLTLTDLCRADLSGADLSDADLSGATLSGANLAEANLSGADLRGAHLSRADLSGADLSGARLSGAVLSGAHLSGANLTGAHLIGSRLIEANLHGVDLRGANLSGAHLGGAFHLPDAIFSPGVRERLSLPPPAAGNPERRGA